MKQKWVLVAIFVVVVLSILLPRVGMPYVFDDVSHFAEIERIEATPISRFWLDTTEALRYYPLSRTIQVLGMKLFPESPIIPSIYQAVVWGLFAVVIYLLVMRLTRNRLASLGSAILCAFSVSAIQITWMTLHTNALLELAIVLGLYGFVCYRDTGQRRWFYLLLGCGLVGPLLRELAIVLPIVVLLVTVVERKWDKKILILLPFLLLHSIFPSTLPNLLIGNLVAGSVFTRGLPMYYSIFSLEVLSSLKLSMPVHLILYVPPILTFLALVSMVISLGRSRGVQVLGAVVLAWGFASVFLTSMDHRGATLTPLTVLPTYLCLAVAIISFPRYKLLSIWFLVAWSPFFLLYNASNPILLAASIPWSILIAIWIGRLPVVEHLSRSGRMFFSSLKPRYMVQYAVILLLVMGFASQPLNLISAHKIFSETNSMEREMGSWMVKNVLDGSVVITNSVYARDVRYYSGSNDRIEFGRAWGVPFRERLAIPNPTALDALFEEGRCKEVYALIVLTRENGERAWLINRPNHPAELQTKFQVVCRYPTLDPIKWLLPEIYRSRGGLPDAARETRINAGLFWEETQIELGMYKLIRNEESFRSKESFTIVVIPDTQVYSHVYPDIYLQQTQWIVDNADRLNIQFVVHVGDLVLDPTQTDQWVNADAAQDILDDADIPNLVVPGNHDYTDWAAREAVNYNLWFPYTRYSGNDWWGGNYDGKNENSWMTLTIDDQEYLFLGLEYTPRDAVLVWAAGVLDAHPDAIITVVTHGYLQGDGTRNAAGAATWDNLISSYSNVATVFCGHEVTGNYVAHRTDYVDGQPINQSKQNWEKISYGGSGWLAYYEFIPNENKISGTAYSPFLNEFGTGAEASFDWQFRNTDGD